MILTPGAQTQSGMTAIQPGFLSYRFLGEAIIRKAGQKNPSGLQHWRTGSGPPWSTILKDLLLAEQVQPGQRFQYEFQKLHPHNNQVLKKKGDFSAENSVHTFHPLKLF